LVITGWHDSKDHLEIILFIFLKGLVVMKHKSNRKVFELEFYEGSEMGFEFKNIQFWLFFQKLKCTAETGPEPSLAKNQLFLSDQGISI
jgi:hypothetical protein